MPTAVDEHRDVLHGKFEPLIPEAPEHVESVPAPSPETRPVRPVIEELPKDPFVSVREHASIPSVPAEAPRESVVKGATVAALGTGAAAGVLPPYAISAAAGAILAPIGSLASFGVPALAATAGYYLGKKSGHSVMGAATGAGLGAVGMTGASIFAEGIAGSHALIGGIAGGLEAARLAALGIYPAVIGAGLYGLGRWHSKVWGSRPRGILGNMARGVVAPVSVPLGYARNVFRKK